MRLHGKHAGACAPGDGSALARLLPAASCLLPACSTPAPLPALQWAHHACVQRWINEKGGKRCEVCQQPFQGGFQQPSAGKLRPTRLERLLFGGAAQQQLAADGQQQGMRAQQWHLSPWMAWGLTVGLAGLSFLLVTHLFAVAPLAGKLSCGHQAAANPQAVVWQPNAPRCSRAVRC